MAKLKCEFCFGRISESQFVELKIPEGECKHCNTETYSEYTFCSEPCAIKHLLKNTKYKLRDAEQFAYIIGTKHPVKIKEVDKFDNVTNC